MIDAQLQARLRARFNPEGSELRRLQLRLLDMVRFIDEVCSANGITWWLSSGSCLGAMRHGGFIPWDDDLDVEMLEKDYRKFLRVMGTEPHGDYILQTPANDPGYHLTFAKLRHLGSYMPEAHGVDSTYRYRGAFVDVFHMLPSSSRKLHDWGIFLEKQAFHPSDRATLRGRLSVAVQKVAYPLLQALDRIGARGRLRHPIGTFFCAPRRREEILPTVRVPFEGLMLPVPADADAYLSRMFGDWRSLPSIDSIHTHYSND